MSDYHKVQEALERGVEPAMLCATCPWDRYCIQPPTITKDEIDKQMEEATRKDKETAERARIEGKEAGMPVGLLMAAMVYSGKDTSASICPVFAVRLRSNVGRTIVDNLKGSMQSWDDSL